MTAQERATIRLELDVTLRLATQADLPKLEWHGQYTHFRMLYRRAYREQQQGRRLMLIADCNDFPIGQIFVQLASAEHGVADGITRAYLYSLRVMEMFRGLGIGTRLIDEAERELIARNFRWATIAVAKDNQRALRLYQRKGYRIFREDDGDWSFRDHRGQLHRVQEPCWILEKELLSLH